MNRWHTRLMQAGSFWQAHRSQGTLGAAGILIGLIGLIFASAIGEGAKSDLKRYIDTLGAGVVFIHPPVDPGENFVHHLSVLFNDDLEAAAGATVTTGSVAFHRNLAEEVRVVATEPAYATALHLRQLQGRFLSDLDVETGRQVMVISRSLANQLAISGTVMGEEASIDGRWFKVIGVTADNHYGQTAYVPRIHTAADEYAVRFRSAGTLQTHKPLLERAISVFTRHAVAEPEIILPIEALKDQQSLRLLLQRTLSGFSAIVLLLGSLSITNTMLMSVLTRHHEIGLRLALGASRRDIIVQFVIESLVICGVGGIASIFFGAVVVTLASQWIAWSLIFNLNVILLAVFATLVISAAAGGIPAQRASQIPPAHVLS